MCSNYRPVTWMDRMLTFFGVERDRDEVPHDVFPTGLAPFIRKAESGSGNKVVVDGAFGLLPLLREGSSLRSPHLQRAQRDRQDARQLPRCVAAWPALHHPGRGDAVRVIEPHSADWATWGKVAGPMRNKQMAERGTRGCIAFPGGAGTASTCRQAERFHIPVWRPFG